MEKNIFSIFNRILLLSSKPSTSSENGLNLTIEIISQDIERIEHKHKPSKSSEEDIFDTSSAEALINKAEEINKEWSKVSSLILNIDASLRHQMIDLLDQFIQTTGPKLKAIIAKKVIEVYKIILFKLNVLYKTDVDSLYKIYALIKNANSGSLESNASIIPPFKKWYGKGMYSILSRRTSANRLSAYKSADEMRKGLDKVMNMLEGDYDIKELHELMYSSVFEHLSNIKKSLGSMLSDVKYDPSRYQGEQKEKLEKLIRQREMREMSKLLSTPKEMSLK